MPRKHENHHESPLERCLSMYIILKLEPVVRERKSNPNKLCTNTQSQGIVFLEQSDHKKYVPAKDASLHDQIVVGVEE